MLPFITEKIKNPWGQYEINQWNANGSQRDKIIYNPQINARFILEEKNTYSACIKIKSGEYKNFWLVPITRTSFLFIAYVPQLEFLNELVKIPVVKKIIPKFPLLDSIYNNQKNSEGYKIDEETRIGSCAIIIKVEESLDDFIFPWRGCIDNEEIIYSYAKLNAIYSRIVSQIEKLYKAAEEVNRREFEAVEAKQKKLIKKTLVKTGIKVAALCIAPYAVAALEEVDLFVDGMDIFDMDISDFSYENFNDNLLDLDDGSYNWDTPNDMLIEYSDYSDDLGYMDYSDDFEYSDDSGYNVSFEGSEKENITVHQVGNSNRTAEVTAQKVPGSSHKWDIYYNGSKVTTVDSIRNGTFYLKGFGNVKIS